MVPPLIWGLIIALSSSMSYGDQDIRPYLANVGREHWIVEWFGWVRFTYGSSVVSVDYLGPYTFIEFFIRKGAHVVAFAILSFLLYRMFKGMNLRSWVSAIVTLSVSIGFASIDEFRQYFHLDRTGMWQDVVLDTVGAIFGVFISWMVYRKKNKRTPPYT